MIPSRIPAFPRTGIALASLGLLLGPPAQAQNPVCTKVYTLDGDFATGTRINVNFTDVADQLQLNRFSVPFPFVNIACSGRNTLVRIDVNTGTILGEYRTAPAGMGADPSRTTVDHFGNVWVANRGETSDAMGSIARVALVIGGTRCNADGTPNPTGQYLAPPFLYSTAVDRDGDGLIKTSAGLGNVLPWTNAGNADRWGGVSTAEDECIINYTRVAGTGTRTLAVDANNDLWTGGLYDFDHERVSGVTGLPQPGTFFNLGYGGYGGLIDRNGILWSARGNNRLLRFDPATMTGGPVPGTEDGYGLGLDPVTGHLWHTKLYGNQVMEIAPNGVILSTRAHGNDSAQGVAVDGKGNVWVAHSIIGPSTTVGHLLTDGTFIGVVPVDTGPTGVAIDANGKVWVANYYSGTANRIDPMAGPLGPGGVPVGAVDMTVNLGPDAYPYNYSDMTGFVLASGTAAFGQWIVIHDSAAPDTEWGTVSWNALMPPGTSLKTEVRAANNAGDLAFLPWTEIQNGVDFCGLGVAGQLMEMRVTFARTAGADVSPVLYDLTVECCNQPPDCSGAQPSVAILWPPNNGWVPIGITGITDPDGDTLTVTVQSIRQDEPIDSYGDGRFVPDGRGVGTSVAELRAERSGSKKVPANGRVYHIQVTADDGRGGTCACTLRVGVPHDVKDVPVDGGPLYDSTGP